PAPSMMPLVRLFRRHTLHFRRQVRQLSLVGLLHAWLHAVLGKLLREHRPDLRPLVGIVDLIAADAPADPGRRHALRVADERNLIPERHEAAAAPPRFESAGEPFCGAPRPAPPPASRSAAAPRPLATSARSLRR